MQEDMDSKQVDMDRYGQCQEPPLPNPDLDLYCGLLVN